MAEHTDHDEPVTAEDPTHHTRGKRFFDRIRDLGIIRSDGWLGGVCAGIAYRIGIDPLIVRGIIVVAALLGAPALLVYGLAWALLPDRNDRIHAERIFRGTFDSAGIAVIVLIVIGFWPWHIGTRWFGYTGWPAFWTVVLLAAVVAFVLIIRRSSRSGEPRSKTKPTLDTTPEPPEPTELAADATDRAKVEWEARREQWREAHDQWRGRQEADRRAVSEARADEHRWRTAQARAEAEERRTAYRRANPKLPATWGWLTIGLATTAGAITGLLWGEYSDLPVYALTAGLAAAAALCAATVMVSGIFRRRAGALLFLSVVLALASVFSIVVSPTGSVQAASSVTGSEQSTLTPSGNTRYVLSDGTTTLDLSDAVPQSALETPTRISLVKPAGPTMITVPTGIRIRLDAVTLGPIIAVNHNTVVSQSGVTNTELGPPGPVLIVLNVTQLGQILIDWKK